MSTKQPVLSISILISGREEMRKCLESLRPFLEELHCELILVDTGCNEEELAIAKEYTDIIIPFTWCNDFSAARNTGLKKATGEWFMFLDDDEWFEDPSEIVSFFKSGEYKKFNGAYYKVRNHVDRSGKKYMDHFVTRMVRRRKETCFKGRVHEALQPLYEPIKTFDTHVEHYGYAYDTEEERKQHSMRNVPLILAEIEEKPDEMRWYGQLAQEYLATSEYKEGAEIALKGIRRFEERGKDKETQYYIYAALYCYAAVDYLRMDDYTAAERLLDKGLEKVKGVKPFRALLLQEAAAVFWQVKRYQDCINASEEYLDIYDKIGTDEELMAQEGFLVVQDTFREGINPPLVIRAALAAAMERNYDKLEYFFFRLEWWDPRMLQQQELEKEAIEAMLDAPYRESFSRMMKAMGERKLGMMELYPVFLEIERTCRQRLEDEKLEQLRRLAAEIDSEHFYILGTKIHCLDKQGDIEGITRLFGRIFEKEESVLDIKEDVWEIAERNRIPLEQFFLRMDFVKWKHALEKWVYIAPFEEAEAWEKRYLAWDCNEDIRSLVLSLRCREVIIRQKGVNEDIKTLEERLENYAQEVLSYYHRFFKEEVFTASPEVLPDEARVSLHYLDVMEKRKTGDARSILQALREMLEIYPVLEEATLYYAGLVKDEVERKNNETENAKRELNALVNSLKTMAKLQISKKEYQTAREILLQVKQCAPNDAEVDEMLNQISFSDGNA